MRRACVADGGLPLGWVVGVTSAIGRGMPFERALRHRGVLRRTEGKGPRQVRLQAVVGGGDEAKEGGVWLPAAGGEDRRASSTTATLALGPNRGQVVTRVQPRDSHLTPWGRSGWVDRPGSAFRASARADRVQGGVSGADFTDGRPRKRPCSGRARLISHGQDNGRRRAVRHVSPDNKTQDIAKYTHNRRPRPERPDNAIRGVEGLPDKSPARRWTRLGSEAPQVPSVPSILRSGLESPRVPSILPIPCLGLSPQVPSISLGWILSWTVHFTPTAPRLGRCPHLLRR